MEPTNKMHPFCKRKGDRVKLLHLLPSRSLSKSLVLLVIDKALDKVFLLC
jgi:hypothetical protein